MSELKMLDYQKHKHFRVDSNLLHQHIADQRMMPIVLSEFQSCAIHFPIVLSKNADTGAFVSVAIFGFEQGENLFWKNGTWDALYTPLNVQRQPFFIGNRGESEDETSDQDYVLCIDESSKCLTESDDAHALFNAKGEPSSYLAKVQTSLKDLLSGEADTHKFTLKMLELDLLVPLTFDITFSNKETQRVDGAYTISEERLGKLSDEQILELYKSGYMGVIYTMFVSLGQLYPLIERKNQVLDGAGDWFKKANA